jgi:hypothetical protein
MGTKWNTYKASWIFNTNVEVITNTSCQLIYHTNNNVT